MALTPPAPLCEGGASGVQGEVAGTSHRGPVRGLALRGSCFANQSCTNARWLKGNVTYLQNISKTSNRSY